MITALAKSRSATCRMNSTPSIPGISRSHTITSGGPERAIASSAASPSAASAIVPTPSPRSSCTAVRRWKSWSSTTSTEYAASPLAPASRPLRHRRPLERATQLGVGRRRRRHPELGGEHGPAVLVRRHGARAVAALAEHADPQLVGSLAERLGADQPLGCVGRRVQVAALRVRAHLQLERPGVDRLQLAAHAVDPVALVLRQKRQPRQCARALRVRRRARRDAAGELLARRRERRARLVEVNDHPGREP